MPSVLEYDKAFRAIGVILDTALIIVNAVFLFITDSNIGKELYLGMFIAYAVREIWFFAVTVFTIKYYKAGLHRSLIFLLAGLFMALFFAMPGIGFGRYKLYEGEEYTAVAHILGVGVGSVLLLISYDLLSAQTFKPEVGKQTFSSDMSSTSEMQPLVTRKFEMRW
jgi:hypothetical protein